LEDRDEPLSEADDYEPLLPRRIGFAVADLKEEVRQSAEHEVNRHAVKDLDHALRRRDPNDGIEKCNPRKPDTRPVSIREKPE
jgi:hypothetical protein